METAKALDRPLLWGQTATEWLTAWFGEEVHSNFATLADCRDGPIMYSPLPSRYLLKKRE
jgi:hypothetical protein